MLQEREEREEWDGCRDWDRERRWRGHGRVRSGQGRRDISIEGEGQGRYSIYPNNIWFGLARYIGYILAICCWIPLDIWDTSQHTWLGCLRYIGCIPTIQGQSLPTRYIGCIATIHRWGYQINRINTSNKWLGLARYVGYIPAIHGWIPLDILDILVKF